MRSVYVVSACRGGRGSRNYCCRLTHKSATWAKICVKRAKLARIWVKFPLDFRFILALGCALRRTANRRGNTCEMSPLLSEANLCVKIDFGQRYGSPHFE